MCWRRESSSMLKNNYFLNANYVILFSVPHLHLGRFTWQQQIFMKKISFNDGKFSHTQRGKHFVATNFAHIFSGINVYLWLKIINVVVSSYMWYKFYEFLPTIFFTLFLYADTPSCRGMLYIVLICM